MIFARLFVYEAPVKKIKHDTSDSTVFAPKHRDSIVSNSSNTSAVQPPALKRMITDLDLSDIWSL